MCYSTVGGLFRLVASYKRAVCCPERAACIQSRDQKPQELFGSPALGRGSHAGGSRSAPTGVGTFGDAPGASRGQGRPPQDEKERLEAAAGSPAAPSLSTGLGEVVALPMIWDFRCRGVPPKTAQSKRRRSRRLFTRSDSRRYSACMYLKGAGCWKVHENGAY